SASPHRTSPLPSCCSRSPRALPSSLFFFHARSTPQLSTLSLHDALPILHRGMLLILAGGGHLQAGQGVGDLAVLHEQLEPDLGRSEEHTSELQSRFDLVCRLLLEKKKQTRYERPTRHTLTRASGPGDTPV